MAYLRRRKVMGNLRRQKFIFERAYLATGNKVDLLWASFPFYKLGASPYVHIGLKLCQKICFLDLCHKVIFSYSHDALHLKSDILNNQMRNIHIIFYKLHVIGKRMIVFSEDMQYIAPSLLLILERLIIFNDFQL